MEHEYNGVLEAKEKTQVQESPLTFSQMPELLNIEGKWEWKLAFIDYQEPQIYGFIYSW